MNNSGNFILKVHIQDNDLKEIFLNKDKRCFTFINDECVADLILPEFKLTSLKMLIKNVVNEEKNDDFFAEYDNDDLKVSEYDKEKINIIAEMVTNITVKDFLEYIDRVKQNDFYVDNIVDIYNATIPEEVKRLISYTTNGFKFNESDIRMLAHEEILDSDFRKDKFIPIFEENNTYYGFDLNERKYAKYVDGSLFKFYDKLDELLNVSEKEEKKEEPEEDIIDMDEKTPEDEESLFTIITEDESKKEEKEEKLEDTSELEVIDMDSEGEDKLDDTIELEVIGEEETTQREVDEPTIEFAPIEEEQATETEEVAEEKPVEEEKIELSEEEKAIIKKAIDDKYNETINNIDDQFEKLNTQVEIEEEEEPKNAYEIDVDKIFSNYKIEIPEDKRDLYKKDLDKLSKEAHLEVEQKKKENAYEMDIASLFSNYNIELVDQKKRKKKEQEEKEEPILEQVEIPEVEESKEEEKKEEVIEIPEVKLDYYNLGKTDFFKDEKPTLKINSSEIKHSDYLLGTANLFKEETSRYQLMQTKFDVKPEDLVVPKEGTEYEFVVSKDITDTIRDSVKKSLKKIEKEEIAEIDLERLIDNSITDSVNNYRIKYNDSMKLVVEHIPYYQNDNKFGVVQIPELEVEKYSLLPGITLDFDRLKFKVLSLTEDRVELLIDKATNISNEDGDKIKKGETVKMGSGTELIYLLDKKGAMESWTLRMEKVIYEKELRRIEYSKLLNLLKAKTNYENLANIEKLETQKSIMLFINFIVKNKETNKLDELYEVINNKGNYAKFVSEYNNNQANRDKNSLPSYDYKKDFLEKLKYVNTLISTDAITYPRYIYASFNYFDGEQLLEDYLEDVNNSVRENDFANYLKGIFKQNGVFVGLDEDGKDNLNKCLEYLSALYKHHPNIGEEDKYKIENTLIVTNEDEDLALLVSKLCRKGIKDYNSFKEYDSLMKEEYRTGNLKYPLYSEDFDIEEVRRGGEYDEL